MPTDWLYSTLFKNEVLGYPTDWMCSTLFYKWGTGLAYRLCVFNLVFKMWHWVNLQIDCGQSWSNMRQQVSPQTDCIQLCSKKESKYNCYFITCFNWHKCETLYVCVVQMYMELLHIAPASISTESGTANLGHLQYTNNHRPD